MKLSVVLSTYNDEKYLAESIQSILDQTYPHFEFIIVNDGSKDGTLNIIKSFNDPRIVLIDKPNTGLIDSLNRGVRAAKYDWIARMDGDDVAEPNRFEEEVKLLKDGVAVVSSQCNIINSEGKYIGKTKLPTKKWLINACIESAYRLPVVHPSSIFNKAIWQEVGGYDPQMFKNEDADLWAKMIHKGDVVISPKTLLRLRKHGNNISGTTGIVQLRNVWVRMAKTNNAICRSLTEKEYNDVVANIEKMKLFQYQANRINSFNSITRILFCFFRWLAVKNNKSFKEIFEKQ